MVVPNSQHRFVADLIRQLMDRLIWPLLLVAAVFIAGTIGFLIIGRGQWSILECAYMTSITLTTVGYGEVLAGMGAGARMFSMILMWTGMGVVLYAVSTVTAFIVEKNLSRIIRERRMDKRIESLKGHIIVCGLGPTGLNVLSELVTTGRQAVAVDHDRDRVDLAADRFGDVPVITGDASQEEVLKRAGVERAFGIIALLPEDSQNMLITVQARYVNPAIRIVARCTTDGLIDKFYRAGADYVVNPAFIGGMRMASVLIRPHVVTFLDRMLRGNDPTVRVEEIAVEDGSPLVGRTLAQTELRAKTGLWPIAVSPAGGEDFSYNPSPEETIEAGTIMIVIGNPAQIEALRKLCRG